MKKTLFSLVVMCLMTTVGAAESKKIPNAEVMLMGVFHFHNPQADYVKTKQMNVMTSENQRYLKDLAKKINEFKPTVVLLEYDKKGQDAIQKKYHQYLTGEFDLPANEIYQLGFRIAKLAGLKAVNGFDERDVQWQAQPLMEYMAEHDKQTKTRFDAFIGQVGKDFEQAQLTKSLKEMLLFLNTPETDVLNKSIYFQTNHVGAGENFVGADAAASWWHRNFRMYANIQKFAQPGERVLAIGGQGHTAILKDLLAMDPARESVEVTPYILASK